jgi:UDP-GlcNAc3NAcA epimerase
VMADANRTLAPIARERSRIVDDLELQPRAYVVTTIHRQANVFQPRLGRIVDALNRLVEPVVLPTHPRTREAIATNGLHVGEHVLLLDPLGFLDFASLVSQARVVLTDSGGLQKEAYWFGVPCVTARPSTEWVDTVEVGANVLVDDDPDRIVDAVTHAAIPQDRPVLYGDGHASERIARTLLDSLPRS